MKRLLIKKVPLLFLPITVVICLLIMGVLMISFKDHVNKLAAAKPVLAAPPSDDALTMLRIKKYRLIKPLLMVDENRESASLASLRQSISDYVISQKSSGTITDASVYIRQPDQGKWTAVNNEVQYTPASILKVAVLIACLKQEEDEPGFLDKKYMLSTHVPDFKEQTITGPPLQVGQSYTVKQLLQQMILYSDNDAAAILTTNFNFKYYQDLLVSFGLPVQDKKHDLTMTVVDMSRLMRVLYNSTYVNAEHSELALELLTHSAYSNGMVKLLDKNVVVAHKFGERNAEGDHEFSETGIIFLNSSPVLLTVCTRGNDPKLLPDVIATISRMVVDGIQ